MSVEEEYPDVLQNIEFIVATAYRNNPEMTDYAALRVYDALAKRFNAEVLGRDAKSADLSEFETNLYNDAHFICECLLGRKSLNKDDDQPSRSMPIDLPILVACLKRLVKSVQKWNKLGGRRGYLDYMIEFI